MPRYEIKRRFPVPKGMYGFHQINLCYKVFALNVQFQKISKILRGRGMAKAKGFKEMYGAKFEFPEGGGRGANPKTIWGGGNGYFLEPHGILLHAD